MFLNPNPDCDKDCRFSQGFSTTTAAYYKPIFDKDGNNVNPDGNTTTTEIFCSICGKSWMAYTRYGKTEYVEIRSDK